MSRVVVIGGGFGGLASAARLAKLGHEVTLLERSTTLGGALAPVAEGGFTWDAGPTSTLLPAVIRDLFRKSGRPVERELDLVQLDVIREHRFEDGTVGRPCRPGGPPRSPRSTRSAPGSGRRWVDHVASYADDWDVLRRHYLETPWDRDALPRELAARLGSREVLHKRLRRTFRDDRLRMVAGHPFVAEGHDLRNVPAWAGVTAYVEQRFGAWTVTGGMAALGTALGQPAGHPQGHRRDRHRGHRPGRCATAGSSRSAPPPATWTPTSSSARSTRGGSPRWPRTCGARCRRSRPVVSYLGLEGDVPDLPHEVVLHGDPTLVVRTRRHRTGGRTAWTVHGAAASPRTCCSALARHRIDVRAHVVTRVDRSPAGPRRALGRLADGGAVAGPRHGAAAAGPDHADPGGVRRRRARHARRRAAVRRPLRRAGRAGGRPGLSVQTVTLRAAKISRVALDRLSV